MEITPFFNSSPWYYTQGKEAGEEEEQEGQTTLPPYLRHLFLTFVSLALEPITGCSPSILVHSIVQVTASPALRVPPGTHLLTKPGKVDGHLSWLGVSYLPWAGVESCPDCSAVFIDNSAVLRVSSEAWCNLYSRWQAFNYWFCSSFQFWFPVRFEVESSLHSRLPVVILDAFSWSFISFIGF